MTAYKSIESLPLLGNNTKNSAESTEDATYKEQNYSSLPSYGTNVSKKYISCQRPSSILRFDQSFTLANLGIKLFSRKFAWPLPP